MLFSDITNRIGRHNVVPIIRKRTIKLLTRLSKRGRSRGEYVRKRHSKTAARGKPIPIATNEGAIHAPSSRHKRSAAPLRPASTLDANVQCRRTWAMAPCTARKNADRKSNPREEAQLSR